ncbi:MAG: TolC family protein [Melioribacteraceae bacterium]|nr:TolC family protein [Melioribacteraceae bacterium]
MNRYLKSKTLSLFLISTLLIAQNTENLFEKEIDLKTCIEYALKNHPLKSVNKNSIGISEAQLNQANSAYWPQIDLSASVSTMDDHPNFIFPSSTFELPSLNIPGLELGGIEIPEQNIKLFDKTMIMGSVELVYPLYTGGFISSLVGQAEGGLLIAKEEARKNELQIVTDVKKRFYAVYMLQKLTQIGDEALARLETTLGLTENMYLKGSGKVTKTDFLKNKIMVDNVRSINFSFKHNLELAKAALLNALGEDVKKEISVIEDDLLLNNNLYEYDELMKHAFLNNPTWNTLEIAQNIFEEKVDQAYSGHLPKIGLMGSVNMVDNAYKYGLVSDVNKLSWTVGIGVQLPIFNGFRTSAEVDEAKYRLEKIKSQKILLENGLGILVKKALVDFESASDQQMALRSAMESAIDNCSLNDRAYQSDLVELQDLIEAQIFEAIMKVQFYKAQYTYYESLAELELIVGSRQQE